MRARSILLPLSLTALALAGTTLAIAEAPPPSDGTATAPASSGAAAGSKVQKLDPRGKTGLSPAMVQILKGNVAYSTRDFPGAIAAYRAAVQEDPKDPLGYYMLGEAQLAAGNV